MVVVLNLSGAAQVPHQLTETSRVEKARCSLPVVNCANALVAWYCEPDDEKFKDVFRRCHDMMVIYDEQFEDVFRRHHDMLVTTEQQEAYPDLDELSKAQKKLVEYFLVQLDQTSYIREMISKDIEEEFRRTSRKNIFINGRLCISGTISVPSLSINQEGNGGN